MNCLDYKTHMERGIQGWFFKFYLAFFHLKVNKREHSSEFYYFLLNSVRLCVSDGGG